MNLFIKLYDLTSSWERNYYFAKFYRSIILLFANVYARLLFSFSKSKNKSQNSSIIVSLTSFPARINNVWMVVECLKRQTVQPQKILLWLSKEQFPNECDIPTSLLKRQDDVFEVRMVDEDIRSHKKYYYALQEYPDSFIVTVDDDLFYPTYLIEKLFDSYKKTKGIVCTWACQYFFSFEGTLAPYNKWPKILNESSKNVFFGSGGGTFFPPHSLYKDVCNLKISLSCCPLADDIWLNSMARLQHTPITYVPIIKNLLSIIYIKGTPSLTNQNVLGRQNDNQLKSVIDFYKMPIWV